MTRICWTRAVLKRFTTQPREDMMTKSTASKKKDALGLLLAPPTVIPSTPVDFPLTDIDKAIDTLANSKSVSTARYFTFDSVGTVKSKQETVCYHQISSHCGSANVKGLGIVFQGYGGFDMKVVDKILQKDRWRKATEEDLLCNKTYPFVNADGGNYNAESLEWLKALLDPTGPFKSLLPLMMENTPEKVQERRCFIFPDVSSIPARLTWCFAIASRIGYANARVLWRYLHLLDKGLDRRTAVLIASGFEHEIRNGEVTGKIIKSYTGGFLGVDTTAYAGRFLSSNPVVDKPFGEHKVGTYGSSKVFESGKIDMKNLTFADWDAVIAYTQQRGREQACAG
jgi:hypothetical protein